MYSTGDSTKCMYIGASLVAQTVENLPSVWETQVPSPLVKEMATHSSILDWRIPMDKGAKQATVLELQRVGHD